MPIETPRPGSPQAKALEAFGLHVDHVAALRVRGGRITIVTHGGQRVTYPGPRRTLTETEKTGLVPAENQEPTAAMPAHVGATLVEEKPAKRRGKGGR